MSLQNGREVELHDVLIPVYNGDSHLELTLQNILSQTYPNIRVIVSDNASTDKTPEILEKYSDDPRVKLIRNDKNIGMFGNWNLLLDKVEAPTFTLISHDDMFADQEVLKRAIELLARETDSAAVFSDISYIDERGSIIKTRKFQRGTHFQASEWMRCSLLTCRNQFGLPIVIRSNAVKNIRFDERLRYGADLGYAINVARQGKNALHISEPLFFYRVHMTSNTLKAQRHALADMRLIGQWYGVEFTSFQRLQQLVNFWSTTALRTTALIASSLIMKFGRDR